MCTIIANSCNWGCCSRLCYVLTMCAQLLSHHIAELASPVLPAFFFVQYYDVMFKNQDPGD